MDNIIKELGTLNDEMLLTLAKTNKDILQFIANVLKDDKINNKDKNNDKKNNKKDNQKDDKNGRIFNPFNE